MAETGKQRAARIPLTYYREPDRLQRWKLHLTVGCLIVAGLWLGGQHLLRGHSSQLVYSRGPVASVHATWETQCESCHLPFAGTSSESFVHQFEGPSRGADLQCQACHAGGVHHANQLKVKTPTCGGCHRDHRGRDASLVRMDDSQCTKCHQNPAASVQDGKTNFGSITRFDTDHPDFAVREDPGKLKFNHKLHLAAGLKMGEATTQLRCDSCHRPEADGRYMAPVQFESHCKSCHPLTLRSSDASSPLLEVPHRLQPEAIRRFLWGAYAEESKSKIASRSRQPSRPLPGDTLEKARSEIGRKAEEGWNFLNLDKVLDGEKLLYLGKTTCGECHLIERSEKAELGRIVAPNVPRSWLSHARFDHSAHRVMDCLACHGKASNSDSHTDVLMPTIDACRSCHAPAKQTAEGRNGGARFDCVECHGYHHGSRDPERRFTEAREFLLNKK